MNRVSKEMFKASDPVRNDRINMCQVLGFSIRSQTASPITLLSASNATNVVYEVCGPFFQESDIERMNNIGEPRDVVRAIYACGARLEFLDYGLSTFRDNLLFVDAFMPRLVADALVSSNLGDHGVRESVARVAEANPFAFRGSNVANFYAHKMKNLLVAFAFGLVPSKPWNGRYENSGGCFYNRNDMEDYLFNNTFFECPSTNCHDCGKLYRSGDGKLCINLKLQISLYL